MVTSETKRALLFWKIVCPRLASLLYSGNKSKMLKRNAKEGSRLHSWNEIASGTRSESKRERITLVRVWEKTILSYSI